jgi:hypothetical protein
MSTHETIAMFALALFPLWGLFALNLWDAISLRLWPNQRDPLADDIETVLRVVWKEPDQ